MRKAILLSFAAVLCGLVSVIQATTCRTETASTCEKSVFMTGTCASGNCACVSSDYTPGAFGCQQKQKAVITAPFDGDVQTGAGADLTCTPASPFSAGYKWFKDGTEISTTIQTHSISSAASSDAGSYTCQSNTGIWSDASDPFAVTVAATFASKKVKVTGVPTTYATDTLVEYTCETGPQYTSAVFEWKVGGTVVASETNAQYSRVVAAADDGLTIECGLTGAESSDQVTLPTAVADIDGVEIKAISKTSLMQGENVILQCLQTGSFPEPGATDTNIVYAWKKDNDVISSATSRTLNEAAESGSYTCTATAGANPVKTSAAVVVTVAASLRADNVYVSPASQLQNGYTILTCGYHAVSTSTPVTYKWFKGLVEIAGVTDRALQFQQTTADYDGSYTCAVTSADGTVTNTAQTIAFEASTVIAGDTPSVAVPSTIWAGQTLTFECKADYDTPGVSYLWEVDDAPQSGETSKTFEYKPTSTTNVKIECAYTFDGSTSLYGSQTVSPEYISSATITVEDSTVTALKPLPEAKIRLECTLVKSSGAGTVTYEWKDGSTAVSGETKWYYEVTAGAVSSSPLSLTCEATAGGQTVVSSAVSVTPQATPDKPVIVMEPGGTQKLGATLFLACVSVSHSDDSTFEWTKDGNVLSGQKGVKINFKRVAATDAGDYTCKITTKGETSVASDVKALETGPNEVTCTYASDCEDPANPFLDSSQCVDGKCQCQSGYTLYGGICSGAAAVMGSLLMIGAALLTHRIF